VIFKIPPVRRSSSGRTKGLALSMMLVATGAHAAVQDITVGPNPPCGPNVDYSYAARPGLPVNETIGQSGATGNVQWEFALFEGVPGMCVQDGANQKLAHCGGLDVTLPNEPNQTVSNMAKVTLTANPTNSDLNKEGYLTLRVTDIAAGNACATRRYRLRVISGGSGWGDPHMTTIDGVHYDFQSAGEFVALRGEKFEVQTRQRPVSTTTVPGPSQYTGLGVCVSLYSAVAARIGSNKVTLQPNLNGQPDPSGLQLRVNGNLVTTFPEGGIPLRANRSTDPRAALEGRVVRGEGGTYEFDDVDGTQLVATPQYWNAHQTWYMNLDVYQTSAGQGIWGKLAGGSWLPALPDGTSLGVMPQPLDQRYQDLYVKFADAWRVDKTSPSLFDYAPGTSTATFTTTDWPRFNAQSCLIQNEPPAQPTTPQIAAQACSAIANPAAKADCTFDVMVTGETGFAQTYATSQAFRPNGPGFQPVLPGTGSTPVPPKPVNKWPWWWWIPILIVVLIVIVVLIAKKPTTA